MENLSEKVKNRLKQSGKTQKELAGYLNISEYGLIKMLQRGSLKSDYMGKIMKFLNVDLNFFGIESKSGNENINPALTKVGDGSRKIDDLERMLESHKQTIEALKQTIESQKELIETLKAQIKK